MEWCGKGKRADVLSEGKWWWATVINLTTAGRVSVSYIDKRGKASGETETFQLDPARIRAPKPVAPTGCSMGQDLVPLPLGNANNLGVNPTP